MGYSFVAVIPYRDGQDTINRLLDSLPDDLPVLVVDDQSEEFDIRAVLWERNNVSYLRMPERGYFSGAVNAGIAAADDKDVLILNQDAYFTNQKWLDFIAERLESGFDLFGESISGKHPAFPYSYVQGTFMYITRTLIEHIGVLDDEFFPLWGATADYQWRAERAGYNSSATLNIPGFVHREKNERFGSSIQSLLDESTEAERARFLRTPPLLTVVIPNFNYGRYLQDAVNSLIGGQTSMGIVPQQTFSGFEVVIVDDASTDNSLDVIRSLIDGRKGVRAVRHRKNAGTAATQNTGVRVAYGRYITILSADDMRTPESLRMLLQAAVERPDRFVYDTPVVYADGKLDHTWKLPQYDPAALLKRNMVPSGILFHRRHHEAAGGYPVLFRDGREDWAFAVALLRAGVCGYRLENKGYLYRREGQNRTLINTDPESTKRFAAQMRMTFPEMYDGSVDPMGCCGKRSRQNRAPIPQRTATLSTLAMQEGMTAVQYLGTNVGSSRWRGPSGAVYVFGNNTRDRVKLVSDFDLRYLLDLREDGAQVFAIAQSPKPEVMPVPDEELVKVEETDSVTYGELKEILATSTITAIKGLDLTREEWKTARELEVAGKNRTTLITWIDDVALTYGD